MPSSSNSQNFPGHATNSPWDSSGFAFPPNTNVLDNDSMPSDHAQAARDKTAEIMAALKSGDTERANALLGKDETKGRILPGMSWIKKKLNARGGSAAVEGVEIVGEGEGSEGGSGKKEEEKRKA